MLVAGFEPAKSYDSMSLIDNVKYTVHTMNKYLFNSLSRSFDHLDILAVIPNYGIGHKLYFRVLNQKWIVWGSNPRGLCPTDLKSVALTTRPIILFEVKFI